MYDDIVKRHRPRGWTLTHSKRRTKMALEAKAKEEKGINRPIGPILAEMDPNKKTIRGPHVVDEYTLHIVLHEFGHVHLKHIFNVGEEPDHLPHHKQEFEADEWAMTIMKVEGIKVTEAIKRSAKRYLRHCIAQDLKAGKPIHTHIAKKARIKLKESEDE